MNSGLYHLADREHKQVQALADRARELKQGASAKASPHRSLGLLFLNPSLRTSASFQRAAGKMQLQLVQLSGDGVWGLETRDGIVMNGLAAEHVREAAAVLGRYVDVLAVRAFPAGKDWQADQQDLVLRAFRQHAGVPVINLESARWHPCQALADWATLDQLEVAPQAKFVLTWAWHPKPLPHAVPNSTLCMAAQRGMEVVLLCPPGWELCDSILHEAEQLAKAHGGSVRVSHDPNEALANAHVVYAKSWGSITHWGDPEREAQARADMKHWCVQPHWLNDTAHFMHCLPIRRNVVASDALLDGPHSRVLDQAEFRLHAQTALLEATLA